MKQAVIVGLTIIVVLGGIGTGIAMGQDSSPGAPAAYYGAVQDTNGNPAPAGTIVVAVVDGQVAGEITVTTAGQYGGGDATDDKLRVDSSSGETVTFHLNSPNGPQALSPGQLELTSGSQQIDLEFPAGAFSTGGSDDDSSDDTTGGTSDPTTGDDTMTGSDDTTTSENTTTGSDDNTVTNDTSTDNDRPSNDTGSATQEDSDSASQEDDPSSTEDTKSSTQEDNSSSSTQQETGSPVPGFTMIVGVAALLGAGLIALRRA